jgi:hypothetical protein
MKKERKKYPKKKCITRQQHDIHMIHVSTFISQHLGDFFMTLLDIAVR